jgi:hypothetical protein
MGYSHQRRLKIWVRAKVIFDDVDLLEQLKMPDDSAEAQRAILFKVEVRDWNCPKVTTSKIKLSSSLEPIVALVKQ